jgi:transcriptional repressor NrdR
VAPRKRPVKSDQIEQLVNNIVRKLERSGESEIRTSAVGELIMEGLKELDLVAYIRFASVYRNFREAKDFEAFVDAIRKPD